MMSPRGATDCGCSVSCSPTSTPPLPPKSCCSTSGKTNHEGTKGTKVFTKKTSQVRVLFAMAVPESSRSARNAQEFSDRKDRLGDFFVLFVSSCFFRANQPYVPVLPSVTRQTMAELTAPYRGTRRRLRSSVICSSSDIAASSSSLTVRGPNRTRPSCARSRLP